jgi:hypothetical protein
MQRKKPGQKPCCILTPPDRMRDQNNIAPRVKR